MPDDLKPSDHNEALEKIDIPHHSHTHTHGHGHHEHHHEHHDAVDYSQTNRAHFDKTAHTYEEIPLVTEVCKKIGNAFLKEYPFDEESTTVLDFACGTGLISRELAPYTKKIVGADISQGMVDQYNLRVSNQGIPSDEMCAIRVELTETDDELGGQKFDVVVCSMAYHHFPSIEDVTRTLVFFLKPGGMLLIADRVLSYKPPVPVPEIEHVVPHKGGFAESTIREVFDSAGLTQFTYRQAVRASNSEREVVVFVAKGTKPAVTTE
ncbi:hypothetical protein M0805_006420 [Coniferiporia weirii]|nr:hypothetical protein M0805_006420 [Coniferiporia weirii]